MQESYVGTALFTQVSRLHPLLGWNALYSTLWVTVFTHARAVVRYVRFIRPGYSSTINQGEYRNTDKCQPPRPKHNGKQSKENNEHEPAPSRRFAVTTLCRFHFYRTSRRSLRPPRSLATT